MEDFLESGRMVFRKLHGIHQRPCWAALSYVGSKLLLQRRCVMDIAWRIPGPTFLATDPQITLSGKLTTSLTQQGL